MKILTALTVLVASLSSFAKTPLITKNNHSGYVPAHYARSEVCQVFADEVVITRSYGKTMVVQRLNVSVSGNVQELIAEASRAEIEQKDNYLCDAPGTTIAANLNEERVLLFSTGGCGSSRKTRTGVAATMLREIVDTYCPKTSIYE